MLTEEYRFADIAFRYYNGENVTISNYEKVLYDSLGKAHPDLTSANHKLQSRFFTSMVDQIVGYLLSNGVIFTDKGTKDKLGKKFDYQMQRLARYARIGGKAFGFFNADHLETFSVMNFVPLYDEETGSLSAGIYFWRLAQDKPLRTTLFEIDGYSEYIWKDSVGKVYKPKRAYKLTRKTYKNDSDIVIGENYPGLPVIQMKNNDLSRSELYGKIQIIDALDLAESNMVNNVDEGNVLYWAINNAGGMDEKDARKVIDRILKNHFAFTEDAEGATIQPHTVEAPFAGTSETIDMLYRKLYTDFQGFNSSAVSAGNQTATAIWACYQPIDSQANKFEEYVSSFLYDLLEIAGIQDDFTFTRDKIINKQEEIQTVLSAASFLSDEYVTKKILTILGDIDMYEDVQKQKESMSMNAFGIGNEDSEKPENEEKQAESSESIISDAEETAGKALNGIQIQSLLTIISQYSQGTLTENQAVNIISATLGISKDKAREILQQ